jgi:hypothetical protein
MLQTLSVFTAVDYNRTLILAIELSSKNWVLAAQVPGLPKSKAGRAINPTVEALMAAIEGYRGSGDRSWSQRRACNCHLRGGVVRFLAGSLVGETRR